MNVETPNTISSARRYHVGGWLYMKPEKGAFRFIDPYGDILHIDFPIIARVDEVKVDGIVVSFWTDFYSSMFDGTNQIYQHPLLLAIPDETLIAKHFFSYSHNY